jgi:plastocyanin
MSRAKVAAATGGGRTLARRRIGKTVRLGLSGAAVAALAGAGESAAQYPTPTMPTPTPPPTTPAPGKNTVVIKGSDGTYRFSPKTLNVAKGKRVRWSWRSDSDHNVTFRTLNKHSKTREQGSYALTFRTRGTYRYLCTVHGFTGKIVVR